MESSGKLRDGPSTGTCAAAAAKASALRLAAGACPPFVDVTTPEGRLFELETFELDDFCAVVKPKSDDPDATRGLTIAARVEPCDGNDTVFIAGEGVGTVTLPGLKVPQGEAAVNPVPRRMIRDAVAEILGARGFRVTLMVPGGEDVAKKTFNPRLGVEGGISILGTSGVVRPMNEASLLESLALEVSTHAAAGQKIMALAFGNTGEAALRKRWDLTGRCVMQTGNYPGFVIDEAQKRGFEALLFCGHPGKLLKVAAGAFQTHNRTADGRMEVLCAYAAMAGASQSAVTELYGCPTTQAAIALIRRENLDGIWDDLASRAARRCADRVFEALRVETAFIDDEGVLLGRSAGAEALAEALRRET